MCDHCPGETHYPDHTPTLGRLQKIKGQLNGIEKMIKDRRYCVDILTQFKAVSAALNMIERTIFEKHLRNCVKSAMAFRDSKEIDVKVKELMDLIFKRLQ
ncbi:MAG: hypothetical protein A2Z91_06560 [Deltaproteobacteria bacterium GWA2_38_16]|nr:MAG: hypothetical protein A2Z91_06560 [Deltaproteobacteria bacterium GWA2_38_16]OGQ03449.1 MAG: hypothetical protein A3D19_04850 [Deltaproteobacteria bacterium RIFCSPHIGHO2_02_FULL_38_15]OGQ30111.1 MAG: hypothetical protein A3A72_06925 [Deltaproteobacteria bacterium RIFCSPLOWO2_01_FULL_38_9]